MRRQHHRDAALAIEPSEQRRDFELIAEIERGGRFVEQEDVWRLRQRAGDDDALLFAAAQRHVRAMGEVRGARGGHRIACDGEVVGSFELKRRRDADAGPSAPFRSRCSRRPDAFPAARRRRAAPARGAECSRRSRPSSASDPRCGRSTPDISLSSVVLPQPFGPSSPVSEPRAMVTLTLVQQKRARVVERATRTRRKRARADSM